MYLTGFADEAATGMDGQIKATLDLGWSNIEARAIDGINLTDISNATFDDVEARLRDAGVQINCFGSAIANWSKAITEPMDSSLEETRRAIPRMHRLGTRLIRIMSFAVLKNRGPKDQMKEERFERLRTLVDLFIAEGLIPVHENCMNYGGMSARHTLELLENVPGLRLVFDTGNPVFTDDHSKSQPYPKQSAWEFYQAVKNHIAYIHIKDCRWDPANDACIFTYCGEGDGDVTPIVEDLVRSGYDGGISIEPHLGAVFHDPTVKSAESADDKRFAMYVEYGKRMEVIIHQAGGVLD